MTKYLRMLELFCGAKSVGKIASKMEYNVTSLDMEEKFNPTIHIDILKWDYKKYPRGYFDFIWASPPCTEFSIAKTTGVRNLKLASSIVRRTLTIIEYFNPKYFVIENPVGLLRHHAVIKRYESFRKTVSYCKYGYKYRKNTDIWTNVNFTPFRCVKGCYCANRKHNGHHTFTVQQGTSFVMQNNARKTVTPTPILNERYSVPRKLVKDILNSVNV
jgi:hypothetical protein